MFIKTTRTKRRQCTYLNKLWDNFMRIQKWYHDHHFIFFYISCQFHVCFMILGLIQRLELGQQLGCPVLHWPYLWYHWSVVQYLHCIGHEKTKEIWKQRIQVLIKLYYILLYYIDRNYWHWIPFCNLVFSNNPIINHGHLIHRSNSNHNTAR